MTKTEQRIKAKYEERYARVSNWVCSRPRFFKALKLYNTWIPRIFYGLYPLAWIYLLLTKNTKSLRFFLVPFVTFIFTTLLRKIINAKRPYEKYDIHPLIANDKKGESFPSRHTLSLLIIALAFYSLSPLLGGIIFGMALVLGLVRVVAGIHFPRDILAALIISLVFGIVGFGFY